MCLAVPGKIVRVDGENAKVSFGGVVKDVSLVLCPEAREGDYCSVHVGMAQAIIDPVEAERVLEVLKELE